MAEWPKRMWRNGLDFDSGEDGELVIPADLGRELYEALKAESKDRVLYPGAMDALARYEREIGE